MRRSRYLIDGAWYHVIARINRGECIFSNQKIRKIFLETLKQAKLRPRNPFKFELVNFCIMGNHIHFLIKPAKGESLSRIMQWILSVFAMRYNRTMKIHGHVWQDRFKSIVVNSFRQFSQVFKYISNNPIKAGLTNHPEHFKYCGAYFISKGDFSIISKLPDI